MLNTAIIMGRLTADPELKFTQSGISVCSFTVAVNRNYSKGKDQETDFIDVVAWRKTAEFICKYFLKGSMIIVEGRIQTRNYEDKHGNKRKAVEIVANNVQFGEAKKDAQANETPPQTAQTGTADFNEMSGDSDDLPFNLTAERM